MKYNKIITACDNGFYIDAHLLKPIGVSDNSHCWGVLAYDNNENNSDCDLILSSIPFRSWACVVRMQVRIKKDNFEDNLKKLYEILAKEKINIYSMQLIHSGYKHTSLDLTLEIASLRNVADECQKKIKGKDDEDSKQEFFVTVAATMLQIEIAIQNEKIIYGAGLNRVNDTFYNESGFNNVFIQDKEKLNNLNIFSEHKEVIESSLINQKSKPLEWNIVRTLAHHFFEQSAHDKKRIRFFYDDNNSGVLKIDRNDDQSELTYSSELLKQLNSKYDDTKKVPFLCLASFNSELNYLRIRSLANENLSEFEIVHKCSTKNRTVNDDIAQQGSIGLVEETMKHLLSEINGLNIFTLHVKNLRRKNRWSEEGSLQIIGSSENELNLIEAKKHTENLRLHLEKTFKQKNKESKFSAIVNYKKVLPFKVFVSYRQHLFDGNNNQDSVTLKLREAGLEPKFSKTDVNNITENVVHDLNNCDACIQIYTLSPEEINNILIGSQENFIPDHAWLLFEYGLAVQKGISIGRMIDVTHYPRYKWDKHLRFNREKLLMEFVSNIYGNNFLDRLGILAAAVRSDIEMKNK